MNGLPPSQDRQHPPPIHLNYSQPAPPRNLKTIRVFAWLYTSMLALFFAIALVCDLRDGGWSNVRLFVNLFEVWIIAVPLVLAVSVGITLAVNLFRR